MVRNPFKDEEKYGFLLESGEGDLDNRKFKIYSED